MTTWVLTITENNLKDRKFQEPSKAKHKHYWEPCNPAGQFQKRPAVGDTLVVICEEATKAPGFLMIGSPRQCPFDDGFDHGAVFGVESPAGQFSLARKITGGTSAQGWEFYVCWLSCMDDDHLKKFNEIKSMIESKKDWENVRKTISAMKDYITIVDPKMIVSDNDSPPDGYECPTSGSS